MKDKKLPQIIILGVLVVLCLGYVFFRLSGSNTQAAAIQPLKPVAETVVQEQSDTAIAPPEVAAEPAPEQVALKAAEVASKKDPFAAAYAPAVEKSTVMAMNPPAGRLDMTLPPYTPPMPMQVVPVQADDGSPSQSQSAIRLTGIIRGSTNVAIIRVGESSRYIVREGQYINGRYKVVSIGGTSVIIALGNERREIKLGGDTNAS